MNGYTKAIFKGSIMAVLGFLFFANTAFASIVLQNSFPSNGNTGTAYNFPQYGGAMLFTATSSFNINSVEFFGNKGGASLTGCARGYVWNTSGGLPTTEIASSTNCIDSSTFPIGSTWATSTFSFNENEVYIASSTQYAIGILWEGTLPDIANAFRMRGNSNLNTNTGLDNRCGLFASWNCATANSPYVFYAYDTGGTPPSATNTRIISFTPENGTTTGNSVYFSMASYVSSEDVGTIQEVEIKLHNIDQNALISFFSDNDIVLYNVDVSASGYYNFATTTYLPDGNYRIDASMRSNAFGFSVGNVILYESHQFIVNQGTFIGNISQNSFNALSAIFGSTTATSTLALSNQCKPFVDWDTIGCLAFLFIPDAGLVKDSLSNTFNKIKVTFPLGYVTRFSAIVSDDNVVPLPDFTASFLTGENATTSLTFSPSEMLAGANTLLTETREPFNGKNLRDIFEPIIQVIFALLVLLYIVTDLTTKTHEDIANHQNLGKNFKVKNNF